MEPIPFDERDRAFNQFVIDYHSKLDNPNWYPQIDTLEIADIVVSDKICFERKRIDATTHDVVSSHKDGRLWEQTEQRLAAYVDCNIILECPDPDKYFYNDYLTEQKWNTIRKTLKWNYHQTIHYTRSYEETLMIILEAFEESIQSRSHVKPVNKSKKPKDLYENQIYLISSLNDCGYEKAKILLMILKTPLNIWKWIMTATIKRTKSGKPKEVVPSIKGFGPEFILNNRKLISEQTEKKK